MKKIITVFVLAMMAVAIGFVLTRGDINGGSNTIGDVAWYDGNSGSKTHPVCSKAAPVYAERH